MSLVARCPKHPVYEGTTVPGSYDLISTRAPDAGSQACADCWELYRLVQEGGRREAAIPRP